MFEPTTDTEKEFYHNWFGAPPIDYTSKENLSILPSYNSFKDYQPTPPPEVEKYNEFFTKSEFACKHCQKQIEMDSNLISFLYDVRKTINLPIIINSGYRCEEHNLKVGGAKNSQHVLGLAADWKIKGFKGKDLERIAIANSKGRVGGIGRSDYTNYVHTDTRPNLIHLAKWCYGPNGSEIPYYDA